MRSFFLRGEEEWRAERSRGSLLDRAVQRTLALMERVVRGDAWQRGVWGCGGRLGTA